MLLTKKDKFAHHKDINVTDLSDNSHVYSGVYDALVAMGLLPFVIQPSL